MVLVDPPAGDINDKLSYDELIIRFAFVNMVLGKSSTKKKYICVR